MNGNTHTRYDDDDDDDNNNNVQVFGLLLSLCMKFHINTTE